MVTEPENTADHPQSESRVVDPAQETETDDALKWIENRGGATTVRELQRGLHRRYPTAKAAEVAATPTVRRVKPTRSSSPPLRQIRNGDKTREAPNREEKS